MNSHFFSRSSCTSILIGKKATSDHSVIIGRNEDAKTAWPKHLAFHSPVTITENTFTSKANGFKTVLPQNRYGYSSTPEWTDRYGVFEEDGINQFHVAMSATESAYANERVLAYDPFVTKTGLLEEAMISVVLPYVKTAREGVARLGELVVQHGAAEADGILFADPEEAWYFEIGSGHHYVAMRIPDDAYAVVANQLAIEAVDFNDDANFVTSPHLKSFIQENHLWPEEEPFDWRRCFGTHDDSDLVYNTPRVWSGQRLLTPSKAQSPQSFELPFIQKPDHPITIEDARRVLSDHYQHTPYDLTQPKNQGATAFRPISVATTQESHLLQLRDQDMYHWLAMGVSAQSVYIPFYPQGTIVPSMFDKGRATYTTNSAYWVFKQASVLVDRDWQRYGSELAQVQKQTQQILQHLRHESDQKLAALTSPDDRRNQINQANQEMAQTAIKAYKTLIADLITQQTQASPLRFKMDPNL